MTHANVESCEAIQVGAQPDAGKCGQHYSFGIVAAQQSGKNQESGTYPKQITCKQRELIGQAKTISRVLTRNIAPCVCCKKERSLEKRHAHCILVQPISIDWIKGILHSHTVAIAAVHRIEKRQVLQIVIDECSGQIEVIAAPVVHKLVMPVLPTVKKDDY